MVLQGRCVNHQALAAHGGNERITGVTSFRPRDPTTKDSSVLTSIRPISNHSDLYYQWTKYRIEVLQKRLEALLQLVEQDRRENKPTNKQMIKGFLQEHEEWLALTNKEIV